MVAWKNIHGSGISGAHLDAAAGGSTLALGFSVIACLRCVGSRMTISFMPEQVQQVCHLAEPQAMNQKLLPMPYSLAKRLRCSPDPSGALCLL